MALRPALRPLLAITAACLLVGGLAALGPRPPVPGRLARAWNRIGWIVVPGAGLAGLGLALLARPDVERWLSRRYPPPSLPAQRDRFATRGRRWTVATLIGLVAGGQVLAMLRHREFWPWSHYSLYSNIEGPQYTTLRVFGRTADGREVPFGDAEAAPFGPTRLGAILQRFRTERRDLSRPLGSLLELYEVNRGLGLHRGPRLVAVQLRADLWDARSTVIDRAHPVRSEVLAEVARSVAGANPPGDRLPSR